MLRSFSPKIGNKGRMPLLISPIHHNGGLS